ncbi:hypothetical protein CFP56_035846, partial [Quercus suber]
CGSICGWGCSWGSIWRGFVVLHVTVKDVVSKARMFKPILKHLESTLDRLAPTVNEITQSSEQQELKGILQIWYMDNLDSLKN